MTDDSTLDQSQDQPVEPNPALRALDVLVGTWQISGRESGPAGEIHGQSRYEWMEGGFYLVQHVDMDHVGHHIKGIEYIGHDPAADNLRSYFFGTEAPGPFGGVALEYVYEVTDETLTIWGGEVGSPASYKGRFVNGRDTVAGAWEWPGGGYEATMARVG